MRILPFAFLMLHPSAHAGAGHSKPDDYTITTTVKIAQPYRLSDMNDEFQSAKLLHEVGGVGTFQITYRPLHVQQVDEDTNWRRDDAKMTEYLRPRLTANWDSALRERILNDLRQAGIYPSHLGDKTLVERVSIWAMKRSSFNDQFGLWMVQFKNGVPSIAPGLQNSYDSQEPKGMQRQAVFDRELYGKGMYLNATHGACTSSSIYLTTILRAIGIPTRIILTVPACDSNDAHQVKLLTSAVRYHLASQAIRVAASSKGFVNHVFNEVFVGGKWVRLNYDRLGQPILDANYGGLLTHVYTALDVSEIPFAQTWGKRFALNEGPTLSSVNPYQLLSAHDNLDGSVALTNPDVQVLTSATVIKILPRGSTDLPAWAKLPDDSDAFLLIKEWIQGQNYMQLREFVSGAASTFTLSAPGQPNLTAALSGLNVSDEHGGFQAFAVKLSGKPVPGVSYRLVANNGSHPHTWRVESGLSWTPRKALVHRLDET